MTGKLFFGNISMWKEQFFDIQNIVTKDFSALIGNGIFWDIKDNFFWKLFLDKK